MNNNFDCNQTISDNISRIRSEKKKAGKKQSVGEIAQECGFSETRFRQIESGSSPATLENIMAVAKALDVHWLEFFKGFPDALSDETEG